MQQEQELEVERQVRYVITEMTRAAAYLLRYLCGDARDAAGCGSSSRGHGAMVWCTERGQRRIGLDWSGRG